MKPSVLLIAVAIALSLAGQAQACRIYTPPTITYDRWFETADRIVLGRVVSVAQVKETDKHGHEWTRPVMEVERTRFLRGSAAPDRISLRGEDLVHYCQPTLHSEILGLAVGDEVVLMLDEEAAAFGLMKLRSELTQAYIARLTPPSEYVP